MTNELNPQAREMADESMVRKLAAQADAIWPQENALRALRATVEVNMLERVAAPARSRCGWRGCFRAHACSAST